MANRITVSEHYKAHGTVMDGDGKFTQIEATYIVSGTASDEDALAAVKGSVPATWGGLPLNQLEIASREALETFFVTVTWKEDDTSWSSSIEDDDSDDDDDDDEVDESERTVSFDCGGGTMHLTHSYGQRRVYGTKEAGGAIGWNGKTGAEMAITGVDVPTAQLRETYTRVMKLSKITTSFKRKVAKLVGKVNSGSFKGWNRGEVMFLGMSYSCPAKKSTKVTVTFNFAVQVNEEATVCGQQVAKQGFEYAWGLSSAAVSSTGAPMASVEAIYVDQVCQYDSFAALGL